MFHSRYEEFHVNYQQVSDYRDKSPKDYQVELQVQKGLWNQYVVNSWTTVRK
ncbi:hypothetical protein ACTHGU_06540 [Chitinophagaceae bacterium MMS25-I14]